MASSAPLMEKMEKGDHACGHNHHHAHSHGPMPASRLRRIVSLLAIAGILIMLSTTSLHFASPDRSSPPIDGEIPHSPAGASQSSSKLPMAPVNGSAPATSKPLKPVPVLKDHGKVEGEGPAPILNELKEEYKGLDEAAAVALDWSKKSGGKVDSKVDKGKDKEKNVAIEKDWASKPKEKEEKEEKKEKEGIDKGWGKEKEKEKEKEKVKEKGKDTTEKQEGVKEDDGSKAKGKDQPKEKEKVKDPHEAVAAVIKVPAVNKVASAESKVYSTKFAIKPQTVLILTPAKNTAKIWPAYFRKIKALKYPTNLISLGFLVSDSNDGTMKVLEKEIASLQSNNTYRRVTFTERDFGNTAPADWDRHDLNMQDKRRSLLAKSRNHLLNMALDDEEWVLWLDADVSTYPDTLIKDLVAYNKSILAPNCLMASKKSETGFTHYDLNTWQETDESRAFLKSLKDDVIVYEGYAEDYQTGRKTLNDMVMVTKEEIVPVDGVGGTVLLVKGDVHRSGAVFPTFSFQHTIETEGFAKMAKEMGYQAYGLPNYVVLH
ncbi:hypothetical protein HK101_010379 [Irineochytrium annulatum]|nr:hypothetical protein HK101_010379 [Irineochytrium annulatum]